MLKIFRVQIVSVVSNNVFATIAQSEVRGGGPLSRIYSLMIRACVHCEWRHKVYIVRSLIRRHAVKSVPVAVYTDPS